MNEAQGRRVIRFLLFAILVMASYLAQILVVPVLRDAEDVIATNDAMPPEEDPPQPRLGPPPSFHYLIRDMHGSMTVLPHLFTRFFGFQMEHMIKAAEIDAKLMLPDQSFMYRSVLLADRDAAAEGYMLSWHNHDMSEVEWSTFRRHVEAHNCELYLVDWNHIDDGLAGYAPNDMAIALPENALSANGFPSLVVAVHEYTHMLQFEHFRAGKAEAGIAFYQYGTDSAEFAAMVVETAMLIHDGFTRREAEAYDHLAGERGQDRPVLAPRLAGGLAWDYIKRYGPQFTGNLDHDLDEIDRWLPAFEIMGSSPMSDTWLADARGDIASGSTTDLAATYQTMLAVDGEPAWFPAKAEDLVEAPEPVTDVPALLANVPQDRRAAVEAFLARCAPP